MSRLVAMSTIIERGSRRADKEFDDHVDPDEWKQFVSEVFGEIHSIVSDTGCRHFETEATIAATGAASYSLPAAYQSTVGVDLVLDTAGRRRPLRGPVLPQRQHRLAGFTGTAYEYALAGQTIVLLPKPSSGTYMHRYIPQATDYSAALDADTIDLVNADGEAFMYWSLKILAQDKGEGNVILAEKRREAAASRLQMWAINRAISEAQEIATQFDDLPIDPAEWVPA